MTSFISIQNTYQELELALFNNTTVIDTRKENKQLASKQFVLLLEDLLSSHKLQLHDLSFIAVNQGPGPFTTLRIVIASVNGLSFASNIPLIGIDGLAAFVHEYHDPQYPNTVVLLNAFAQDVYFAIERENTPPLKGYKNVSALLEELPKQFPDEPIRFLGNGADMYQELIKELFGNQAYIPEQIPQTCSVQQIGIMGLSKWQEKVEISDQLYPLYLKKHRLQQ